MLKAQCSQVQDRGGKNRWQGTQAKCRRIFLISVRFLNNSNIFHAVNNVPQQRKLMRSSAQNSCGAHWSRRRSGSTRFWRRFRRLGGLGAEPGHVQQGSGEGSRKPWCKAKSSSTGSGEGSGEGSRKLWQAKSVHGFWRRLQRRFRRRFWESLVQGQVMFKKGCGEVCFSCLRCTLQKEL